MEWVFVADSITESIKNSHFYFNNQRWKPKRECECACVMCFGEWDRRTLIPYGTDESLRHQSTIGIHANAVNSCRSDNWIGYLDHSMRSVQDSRSNRNSPQAREWREWRLNNIPPRAVHAHFLRVFSVGQPSPRYGAERQTFVEKGVCKPPSLFLPNPPLCLPFHMCSGATRPFRDDFTLWVRGKIRNHHWLCMMIVFWYFCSNSKLTHQFFEAPTLHHPAPTTPHKTKDPAALF